MKKDIIYIDVEDDITAVIGKVKSSKEAIVALVPPKRIGVLQSAVNLRLLERAATQAKKRVVLITGNQALSGLAAAASIPVARNLQSKPEIAEIPALDVDNGNDVIDGSQLPVGEHAVQRTKDAEGSGDDAELIKGIDIENEPPKAAPVAFSRGSKKTAGKKNKVPNFSNFRKRFIIAIIAGVLLIGGLVWALVFAPAATIVISARTTDASVNDVVTFATQTNAEQGTVKTVEQKIEREVSIEFEATGERDAGDKATGSVTFSTRDTEAIGTTIPAGTTLRSSSGLAYVTNSAATITFDNRRGVRVGVTAAESGEKYNAATGSVSGSPAGINASFTGPTSGGTTRMVKVVTAADVQSARQKLVDQSTDTVRQELSGKFNNTTKVIEASFNVDYADVAAQPDVNGEVESGAAKLTGKAVYTLIGVDESELREYLEQTLKQQMPDQTTQRIYNPGVDDAQLNDFARSGDTLSVRLIATGKIGPVIKEDEIKERVAGKRFGEIQSDLSNIDGVNDVDVSFSYFWVRTVPNNPEKITIEFDIENGQD